MTVVSGQPRKIFLKIPFDLGRSAFQEISEKEFGAARRLVEDFWTSDLGLFTQNFGLPDPGTLLAALADHYEFTADGAWLRGIAPSRSACRSRNRRPAQSGARPPVVVRSRRPPSPTAQPDFASAKKTD